jgi:hypothetical protein
VEIVVNWVKKKIILKLLFFNIVFLKAELQKALTFAEEQMENVKVWILFLITKSI